MSHYGHRIVQLVLLAFSLFMLWGGGFFWRDTLAGTVSRTTTYTLYRTVPPPIRIPLRFLCAALARSTLVVATRCVSPCR